MNHAPVSVRQKFLWPSAFLAVAALTLSSCGSGTESLDPLQLEGPDAPPLTATQWQPYAGFTVSASGGKAPYTFSLNANWPDGITIDVDSGEVTGTPTEAGAFTGLAVMVEDSTGETASFELGAELDVLPGLPSLTLETGEHWWETDPPVDLSAFSSLRMRFTFENTSGADMEFLGAAARYQFNVQVWTEPDYTETPTLTFDAFPLGTYAPGEQFSWEVTVALDELASSQTTIAVRPTQEPGGGVAPRLNSLRLVDADLTITE